MEMGWLFVVIGIVLVVCGNVPGAYHKDRKPKTFVRVVFTLGGIGILFVGIHYLGVAPFLMI